MLYCTYCNKECKNSNSLRNHERLCKHNPNRQLTSYERGIDPFYNSRIVGPKSSKRGEEHKTATATRQCPHCLTWFEPMQIGGHVAQCSKLHNEERRVMHSGVTLDITVPQLEEYKKQHTTCEICGKSVDEVIKYTGKYASKRLCIDHDHTTNKFRGMLCQVCNRQLGWYEKYKQEVGKYLSK